MTGYNSKVDVESFNEERVFDNTKLKVRVMSYKEGEKKIHISRENNILDADFKFTKLGRLNRTEAEFVVLAMVKALEDM
jgi:hypothetical protein|tara:strand:- start:30327 stop:30563 length:237 start_codon:yes stop_codon:yes gene_type:complete